MKRILWVLSAILIGMPSYSQSHLHSGINDRTALLFDSGRVTINVKEYNFDSCGITKRQIYKCEFIFKNDNPYPVKLKRYDFYTENVTDSINKVGCSIARVSINKNSDTLIANSIKVVTICGETQGLYQPTGTPVNKGCVYHWEFNGFTLLKKYIVYSLPRVL